VIVEFSPCTYGGSGSGASIIRTSNDEILNKQCCKTL